MQTANINNYLQKTEELLAWRAEHEEDTPEEDRMLEIMDDCWRELNEEEREWLNFHIFKTP